MIDNRRVVLRPESAEASAKAKFEPPLVGGSSPPPRVLSGSEAALLHEASGSATAWVFVPLAPLVVIVVGLAVALSIGVVGLDHLARAGGEHASARADLLAATLAARLSTLPESQRLEAVELARRRTAAEILVLTPDANVVYDVTLGAPVHLILEEILRTTKGVVVMRLGRARFSVRPIGDDPSAARLVVFVAEPASPIGASALVSALGALAVLLLGTAAIVAYAVSRNVTRDVDFITHRVEQMARARTEPTGEPIPARTMDKVGLLTVAFNELVERFEKAQSQYREDLDRAHTADRERAAFLAAVSHELRSPLNAILGFADILMAEVDGPLDASAREEVEQIRGSGAHLLGLINDILEFSALESGQLRLTRRPLDLTALASKVVSEARGLVGNKPIAVRLESSGVVRARVDGRRMRQILGNLVNNAIKFMQHGEVVVHIAEERGLAMLRVTDTGPGISAQERELIFREYKQASGEVQKRRGTGLGLAIAKRLVLLHHGSIQVDSELGRGSIFTVLVPKGRLDEARP